MITVVITTYQPQGPIGIARGNYHRMVLDGLKDYLSCKSDEIEFHVADDSPTEALSFSTDIDGLSYSCSFNHGIGASLNEAMDYVDDLWLYCTDDWLLKQHFNLDNAIRLLREYNYGCVRIGHPHPNLSGMILFDRFWWFDIDPSTNGMAFATRPFLATKRFYETIGPFKEGVDAYEAEYDYSRRARTKSMRMAQLIMDYDKVWEHIGEVEVGKIVPSNR